MKTSMHPGKVYKASAIVNYDDLQVRASEIMENVNGSVTILAFRQGQTIQQHAAPGAVLIVGIEGRVEFTLDTERQVIHEGDIMLMAKGTLHSVKAVSDTKFLLVKIAE